MDLPSLDYSACSSLLQLNQSSIDMFKNAYIKVVLCNLLQGVAVTIFTVYLSFLSSWVKRSDVFVPILFSHHYRMVTT